MNDVPYVPMMYIPDPPPPVPSSGGIGAVMSGNGPAGAAPSDPTAAAVYYDNLTHQEQQWDTVNLVWV